MATTVLQGTTGNLSPVCCITGGPEGGAGPYSALVLDLELFPGNTRQFTWAMAALDSPQNSYDLAQRTIQRAWDAERTRLELQNEGQWIEIQTGEPEWDLAFALSQKVGLWFFFPGGKHLPYPSFVLSRQQDQGYSIRGDGSDYPYLWNGQTPLDAWYLANILLPGATDLLKGLFVIFLKHKQIAVSSILNPVWADSARAASGAAYFGKPGLSGFSTRFGFQLAERLVPCTAAVHSSLVHPEHDRDGDGFPEWDHPLQTGLEDAPMYDRYQPGSQGASISAIESPALAAFLYRECASLLKIARRDRKPGRG
jgi:hypothetical protein